MNHFIRLGMPLCIILLLASVAGAQLKPGAGSVYAVCDSVVSFQVAGDSCCFGIEMWNIHQPAGEVNAARVRVLTPGVTIRPLPAVSPPSDWTLSDYSPVHATFSGTPVDPGGLLRGLLFCFDGIAPGGTVTIEWCSILNGNVVCCVNHTLQCGSGYGCDDVLLRHLAACCFDFTVVHRHVPMTGLSDFHLKVITPGVTIQPNPTGPPGWKLILSMPATATFKDTTFTGIPFLDSLSGFRFCFEGGPADTLFAVAWYTTIDDVPICYDTLWLGCHATGLERMSEATMNRFIINQNYPNPFSAGGGSAFGGNPGTTIGFELPIESFVSLKVFNILGREVATLVNRKLEAGGYTVPFDGSDLAPGVYLYRMQAGSFTGVRKLMVIK